MRTLRIALATAVALSLAMHAFAIERRGFEENRGQFPADVLFRGRTAQMDVFVHATDLRIALPTRIHGDAANDFVQLAFADANPAARVDGAAALPGKTNYFRADARIDGVRTFDRVAARALYEHIDLELYTRSGQIEFDFIVRPGGDPAAIRLMTSPTTRAELDRSGHLLLRGETGATLRVKAPHIYQLVRGERREVAGAFEALPDGSFGFRVGRYNRSLPLVIDPVLEYATYVDGSGPDNVSDVFVDSLENRFIVGTTDSDTNFPPAGVPKNGSRQGHYVDAYVAKYSRTGAFLWATIIGGVSNDIGRAISADDAGFVYVTGTTHRTGADNTPQWNFATTPGAYRSPYPAAGTIGWPIWVMKLNDSGTTNFAALLGGSYPVTPRGIGTDAAGNIYVGGDGGSARLPQGPFPTTPGAYQRMARDLNDAFVFRLNNTGTTLLSSTLFGGNGTEQVFGFDVEPDGTMWIGGSTTATDLPTTPDAYQPTAIGGTEGFIARFSADCRRLLYASYLRSTQAATNDTDRVRSLVVDREGSLYVGGLTFSDDFPITDDAYGTTGLGFVMKFDPTRALEFSARLPLEVVGIAVDGGAVVAVGSVWHYEPAIPLVSPTQPARGGVEDAFVMRLNPAGSALEFSTYLGGSSSDTVTAIAMSPYGNATVVGGTLSDDFPVTAGAAQPTAIPSTEGGGTGIVLPNRGFVATYVFDLDRDGLLDIWETTGIDINGDGTIDLTLPGATPNHKDIFVEVDYMAVTGTGAHTHDPKRTPAGATLPIDPIESVKTAFANAPVANPDGVNGIRLHVFVGEEIPEQTPTAFGGVGVGFDAIKRGVPAGPCTGRFGTSGQRADANCANILRAKRLAYRYAIFGHELAGGLRGHSGIAELGGNDFMVMLSTTQPGPDHQQDAQRFANNFGTTFADEWSDMIAGTFMHELGHTLGLDHGGGLSIPPVDRPIHCKPNYISVMNYTRTWNNAGAFPGAMSPVRLGRTLDYSRAALPDLEELALSEPLGIAGPAGHLIAFGRNGTIQIAAAEDPIDWNGVNGIEPTPVAVDVNYIRGSQGDFCGPQNFGQALAGHDDWPYLVYSFRASRFFLNGAPVESEEPTAEDGSMLVRGTRPPLVTITAPAADARLGMASLTISATVDQGENAIAEVEFLVDEVSLGTDTTAPYSFTWLVPTEGTHVIRVRATDTIEVSNSAVVTVHIGCTATLTPSSATVPSSGGTASVTLTIPTPCTWTAMSTTEWVTVSPSDGSGATTLVYTALANETTSQRAGSLAVNDETFTVTQDAAAPFGAPTGLVATALLDSAARPYIAVSWNAVADVAYYDVSVQRAGSTTSITTYEPSLVLAPTGTISGAAYLFKVRAVNAAGTQSAYSAPDLATVVFYTDDPIVPLATTAKLVHITELRAAVNAVRALAGLAAATWTTINVGDPIITTPITELRTALDAARSTPTLALPAISYTDPTLSAGTRIKAAHVQELRGGTK